MLGVSPTPSQLGATLRLPQAGRTEGGHRQFELGEIEALRQAFTETGDIVSAVSVARERGEGPSSPLRLQAALADFREDAADRVLEQSLAVRSVERTVESVLLSAVELLEPGSPERAFARRYAGGWLAAATRVAPGASREEGAMILDASAPPGLDGLYVQALELFLRRRGLRVLTLSPELEAGRIGAALRALRPGALVLAGAGADATPQRLSRLVYAARRAEPGIAIFDYRLRSPRPARPPSGVSGRALWTPPSSFASASTGVVLLHPAASAS